MRGNFSMERPCSLEKFLLFDSAGPSKKKGDLWTEAVLRKSRVFLMPFQRFFLLSFTWERLHFIGAFHQLTLPAFLSTPLPSLQGGGKCFHCSSLPPRNMSPPNFICRWCIAAGWLSGFHAVVNGRGPVTGIRAVLQLPEPKRMQDVIEPI